MSAYPRIRPSDGSDRVAVAERGLWSSRHAVRDALMEIGPLSHPDYCRVLEDLADFWDGDRTRGLHHPMFVREFGGSALIAPTPAGHGGGGER